MLHVYWIEEQNPARSGDRAYIKMPLVLRQVKIVG